MADPDGSEIARAEDLAPARDFARTFVDGDLDLFDDGSVLMLAMPGHTPGNTSLVVRLPGLNDVPAPPRSNVAARCPRRRSTGRRSRTRSRC